jgi:hypothetical protein
MKTLQNSLFLLLTLTILHGAKVNGQVTYDFGFKRDFSVPVTNDQNLLMKQPWAGGMNSVHTNQIDLNQDGILDLLFFDTQTSRLLPFINQGTAGVVNYVYAPQYEKAFPKLYSWIKTRDFNCDGKMDLFTYGFAGIKVYLNTSTPATGLTFSLYTPILNAYQGGNYTNILVTSVDYPAIEDVDGDGDLDILVFYGLGSLVQYYKNMSKEQTGTCDTLWMELKHRCFGWFSESDDDNGLNLNIDLIDPNMVNYCQSNLKGDVPPPKQGQPKHTGSTMLMLDLTGNNLMDLLLGDTDYPTVAALYNTGTTDSTRFTSVDSLFPAYGDYIDIYAMANIDYIDVDNDGKKDLIAGAFDPGWEVPKADNINSVWFYKNTSSTNVPYFALQQKDFIQGEMIDVGANSHPVLFDYNNDGLLDLFVGTLGLRDSSWMDPWLTAHSEYSARVSLYENTGTPTQPAFKLITNDFAGISALGIVGAYPTFGDLNGDGKPDMILGDTTGRLHYYENIAPAGQPMQLNYVTSNYKGIDVGMYSTPQLFDLDNDGLLDLAIGYRKGLWIDGVNYLWKTSVAWYKNTGSTTTPQFTLQTDSLGGVNVNDSYFHYYDGYSAPHFYRDSAGVVSLFVGSGAGLVFYYRDITGNLTGSFGKDSNMVHITDYDHFYSVQHFENDDHQAETIEVKLKSAIALGDLNNDGYPEMIVGNWAGGLNYFRGTPPLGVGIAKPVKAFEGNLIYYPNPAYDHVNIAVQGADRSIRSTTIVYNIAGQQIMRSEQQGDDVFRVDVSALANGTYIMRIEVQSLQQGTTGVFNRKLIIKR